MSEAEVNRFNMSVKQGVERENLKGKMLKT